MGLSKRLWQAHFIERIFSFLPLHEVVAIDFVALEAIVDILASESGLAPSIAFASHPFAVGIFPVAPILCWIARHEFAENHHRVIHSPCQLLITHYRQQGEELLAGLSRHGYGRRSGNEAMGSSVKLHNVRLCRMSMPEHECA